MEAQEYEERKLLLEELKRLVKSEQEAIFRLLKSEKAEYSENSNGIFFDVCKLPTPVFKFTQREEEERKAQEVIDGAI